MVENKLPNARLSLQYYTLMPATAVAGIQKQYRSFIFMTSTWIIKWWECWLFTLDSQTLTLVQPCKVVNMFTNNLFWQIHLVKVRKRLWFQWTVKKLTHIFSCFKTLLTSIFNPDHNLTQIQTKCCEKHNHKMINYD